MTNIESAINWRDFTQILSNVSKYLSSILKQSNGLKLYEQYEANLYWQSLQNSDLKIEALFSQSVTWTLESKKNFIFENFKNIIAQKYDKQYEKLIYDKIHEEFLKIVSPQMERHSSHDLMKQKQLNSNSSDLSNEPTILNDEFTQTKIGYSILDKLKLTRPIWYLPNLKKASIKKILKNKEIGNFVLNEQRNSTAKLNRSFNSFDKSKRQLTECNLVLHVLVESISLKNAKKCSKMNEYPIKLNKKTQLYYLQIGSKNDATTMQFKSIYCLLEYYMDDSSINEKQLKLSLPKVIIDAYSLEQLFYFSSLKQDFWLQGFLPQNTNTYSSSQSTTSSLSKEYFKEFKKPHNNSARSTIILKNNQTKFDHIKAKHLTDSIVSVTSSINSNSLTNSASVTKPQTNSPISFSHKNLDCIYSLTTNSESHPKSRTQPIIINRPARLDNTTFSSSVPSTTQIPQSQQTSNLNRIFFRTKRSRSKSLDHFSKTERIKNNFLFPSKSKNNRSKVFKERFFYDPRFNKTPELWNQFTDSSFSSYRDSVSSQSSSNSSRTSIKSNNFFTKLQWPPKFLNHKLKSNNKTEKGSFEETNDKPDLSSSPHKKSSPRISFLLHNLFKVKSLKEPKLNTNESESSSFSISSNTRNFDFDTVSLNSATTFIFTLADQPPPLPQSRPPSTNNDSDREKPPSKMGLFSKSLYKTDAASPGFFRKTNKIISKKEETVLPLEADSFESNEYSEPFDLIPTSSQQKIESCTALKESKFKQKNTSVEVYLDDDSAYSSSYISQSIYSTSPKAKKTILGNHKATKCQQENFEIQEDPLTTFDSYAIQYSSSDSSSPLSPLSDRRSTYHNSNPKILPSLAKQPVSSKPSNLPILSEYESVNDSLLKNVTKKEADIKNGHIDEDVSPMIPDSEDKNAYEKTINAFEKMSTRCELLESSLELEDSSSKTTSNLSTSNLRYYNSMPRRTSIDKTKQLERLINLSSQNSTLKKKLSNFDYTCDDYYQKRSYTLTKPTTATRPTYTSFLDRTLTFNNLTVFSSVLSTANEPSRNFASIRNFVQQLSHMPSHIFGNSISEFISCVNNSKQIKPSVLMSDTRQFMNGIKNYLIKNNVSSFNDLIEHERVSLETAECFNINSILEDCLQSILFRPLKAKIYYLLVDWLIKDDTLVQISKNIKLINSLDETRCLSYLALKKPEHRLSLGTLKTLRVYYNRMQCEYAPLVKLKYILYIVNEILLSNKDFSGAITDLSNLDMTSFMPVVIYAICKSGMSALQIEIDYVWGLACRSLLTNECIYYLTMMSSVCFVLKGIDSHKKGSGYRIFEKSTGGVYSDQLTRKFIRGNIPIYSYMDSGLLEVYLPDEKYETVRVKKIPLKPNSRCKDVNSMIATKFKIFDSAEYGLYFLENGVETRMREDDQPLEIKIEKVKNGSRIKFVYKKKSDNLIWPNSL